MDGRYYGFRTSANRTVGSGDRSGADVCIWLRTPLRLEAKFVSGNCARGAREFIRWTVKTFDRRGW
jgi:hypothetical protein